MMTFREFLVIREEFNNVLDFLLNPDHRNKTWFELMDEFRKSGGEEIGAGKFGAVYSHPNWSYVVKVFNDPHYLKFVRFANRNPHPSFPKFFGVAQRIVPFYKRYPNQATTYIIRMEKLYEVKNKQMLDELIYNYEAGITYIQAEKAGKGNEEIERRVYPGFKDRNKGIQLVKEKAHKRALSLIERYPQAHSLFEAMYLVWKNIKNSSFDIHSGNIMQRSSGELVLIDPLWEGSNPYLDAARIIDMETDRYGNEQDEPSLLGGELPKKKRKRKQKRNPKINYTSNVYTPF